ncbi:MAG: RNA polymerase sigma factor, partial [Planctomycetota bacterium]|nr:RNA polymerase sigma factor [Planctomycetota bacterium]
MPTPPAQPDALTSLLADGAWLKRLAVGLVGESGAEDLAQDVMVSAMRTPPQGTGAQLRAWAKTVARRLAARGGERGRNREHAEQRAARPEASDEASEQRLHLHRRLTDAILALEPAHRTVLVMRFLDDLSPKEIAARLDVAQPTARKRISRALAKLREQLDGEFGDRTTWMNAVGPLAFGIGWKDMLPTAAMAPTAAATLPPLLALWTMKKLAITSIALCLALWVGFEIRGGAQADLQDPGEINAQAGLIPTAEPEPETTPNLASTQTTEVRGQAAPIAPIPKNSPLAQIILVDPDGNPATGGKGAWLTPEMEVHPLTFSEEGCAVLPEAAVGMLCLVRAEGYAIQDFLLESVRENITIELGPMTGLKGRLLVDGGPPPEATEIECTWYFAPITPFERTVTRMEQDQGAILRELGLMSGQVNTHTLPGGGFVFEGVQPASHGHVQLPRYLKILPDGKWTRASFQKNENDLIIESTSLPYVYGRLIWADDETPYTENVNVQFTNRRNEEYEATSVQPSESGAFVVPLEYLSPDKAEGLKHTAIRLQVEGGSSSGGQDFRFPVNIETPVRDAGVLRVNRKRTIKIRTVSTLGEPVAEAFVESSLARGRTDDGGRISLPVTLDGMVLALANGHGFTAFDMATAKPSAAGEYVIHLPQGNDLTITARVEPLEVIKSDTLLTKGPTTFIRVALPNGLLGANSYGGRSA